MKIYFLFLLFISNLCLSQEKINDFKIQDLNNSITTINYLQKASICDILIFADNNYKFLTNPNNIKRAELIFSAISKRTKQGFFFLQNSRHLRKYIQTLREENLKEQIKSLEIQNKCHK